MELCLYNFSIKEILYILQTLYEKIHNSSLPNLSDDYNNMFIQKQKFSSINFEVIWPFRFILKIVIEKDNQSLLHFFKIPILIGNKGWLTEKKSVALSIKNGVNSIIRNICNSIYYVTSRSLNLFKSIVYFWFWQYGRQDYREISWKKLFGNYIEEKTKRLIQFRKDICTHDDTWLCSWEGEEILECHK